MLPEPIACSSCGFPRTLRVGSKRVCFQCRCNWPLKQSLATLPQRGQAELQCFTPAELARLLIYRAAARAGFFTDWY